MALIFHLQLVLAGGVALFPQISLFQIIIATQVISAFTLPPILCYLIRLTGNRALMDNFVNNRFQKYFSIVCTAVIEAVALATLAITVFNL